MSVQPFQVISNQNLTPFSSVKSIYHLKLYANPPLPYAAGDWLRVFSENQPGLVDLFLQKMGLLGSECIELRRVGRVSVREALLKHLELTQLNPAILNKCQRWLGLDLWADRQEMMDFAAGKDVVDLIEAFDWVAPLGLAFVGFLSMLSPRYYSICSAPEAVGVHQVEVLFREVRYYSAGRERFGVASHFLAGCEVGSVVQADWVENRLFKLPDSVETPVLMFSAGTGVAPFRGFLQSRFAGTQASKNWLFFGEVDAKAHFLFADELRAWEVERGLVVSTAFSREQVDKVYVQDVLWEAREAVWAWIEQGAALYICGDKNHFAKAVEATLLRIATEVGGVSSVAAWLGELKSMRRWQTDVY